MPVPVATSRALVEFGMSPIFSRTQDMISRLSFFILRSHWFSKTLACLVNSSWMAVRLSLGPLVARRRLGAELGPASREEAALAGWGVRAARHGSRLMLTCVYTLYTQLTQDRWKHNITKLQKRKSSILYLSTRITINILSTFIMF